MNKIKYIILMLLFTTMFIHAERNPLLNLEMDKTNGGIIDIGVNDNKADQLTTYIKELISTLPETKLTQKKIEIIERNTTKEDCITDQFLNEGCTLASVDCVNTGEKLTTPAIDHVTTIDNIAKITEDRVRQVPFDVGTIYSLSNTKSTIPPSWSGILAQYPVAYSNNYLYTYKFYAAYSGYYHFKFMANGSGTMYVDNTLHISVSSSATQGYKKVYLARGEHYIKFRANGGDLYKALAATISYPNSTTYPFWNTMRGQTGRLSYSYSVVHDYRAASSCDLSSLVYCPSVTNMVRGSASWRTYNFYARYAGTYKFYLFTGSAAGTYVNVDGVRISNGKAVNEYKYKYLGVGWHNIQYYNAAGGNNYVEGCDYNTRQWVLMYIYNPNGSYFWNTRYCQVGQDYWTTWHTYTQPNYYSLNIAKATIPPTWSGILRDYPINFTNGVNKTFSFFASEEGNYELNLKSYIRGNLYIDGSYKLNATDFRYLRRTTVHLTQGEHIITFNGDHLNSIFSGWATTIVYNGTIIWNTLHGQVAGTSGIEDEDYVVYLCPEGFTDSANDETIAGNTCKKTYTWRTYTCPADVSNQGLSWVGPVVNAGGDCGGVGVSDGGVCAGQPVSVAENCVRDLFTCPTDQNQLCVAEPNSTETQNISNGYKYIPGNSSRTTKVINKLKSCPEASMPIYFCPTGWAETDNTRECIKAINSTYDIKVGLSQDDCTDGFEYSNELNACVRVNNLATDIVIDADSNAFYLTDQSEGYNDQLNVCLSRETPICTQAGFKYKSEIGQCVKSKLCLGTVIDGQCLEKPRSECPTGMAFDIALQKCTSTVECARGDFNEATLSCQDEDFECPGGTTYNEAINKCEKQLDKRVPICPEPEMAYNLTTKICRGQADFSGWSPIGSGSWAYNNETNTVYQSVNTSGDTFYISNRKYKNSILEGKFSVGDDGDDDFAGIVFGYVDSSNNFVFAWKKADQSSFGEIGYEGFQLFRYSAGTKTLIKTAFDEAGWQYGRIYNMKVEYSEFTFKAYIDGTLVLEYNSVGPFFPEEGYAGFYNLSQSSVTYQDFIITTKPICDIGYILSDAYNICYLRNGSPEAEYNFETEMVYENPECFAGGIYDPNTSKCSYASNCPVGSTLSTDRLTCLSDTVWSCSESTWTYQPVPSPFVDLQGSCQVPSDCPPDSVEITDNGQIFCASTNMTGACETGYTQGELNGKVVCLAAPFCPSKWLEENYTCSMKYSWEEYSCPDGWEGPLSEAVGDCDGSCDYNGCNCDSPIPPANNCRQLATSANNGIKIEKRRKMELHNVISGDTLGKADFGTMRGQICTEFPEDCSNYVDEIRGENNKICFKKSKTEEEECFEVEGCSFFGKIKGLKQIGDTINIKAVDNSKFDYADPQDPAHTSWDSYGFSISRHALLLSDGNWYIAENQTSSAGRGCGVTYINGLGGLAGFKTIPNSNYNINISEAASRCLIGITQVGNDCAKDIDITLPDGLTLVSISDLESVVSNVFMTQACNGDNTYDEHFIVNYDVTVNRTGTGTLSGTSFTSDDGSSVLGEGYGHDVVHSLTLIDNHTIFGGYERTLGFRGTPTCGVYRYDPITNACITPINYNNWVEFGDDSEWSEVTDGQGDIAMVQIKNTAFNAFFISPYEFDSYNMDGYVGVGTRSDCGDDDTIGLTFGFKDINNYYALFWGGDMRDIYGNTCPWYSNLSIVKDADGNPRHSPGRTYRDYCCNNINTIESARCGGTGMAGGMRNDNGIRLAKIENGAMTTLGTMPNSDGWKCGIYAHFKITSDINGIQVWKDDNKIFDLPNERAPEGKAGYYGLSQGNAYYKGFKVSKAPTCPIGTRFDEVSDRCKEIGCPNNLTYNKDTNTCQQILKSTCALNGNLGWTNRQGGVVSVGSSEEAKSYIYLSINDEASGDFGDGTQWKGFNQSTMAIKLSDGYWYVSSYLYDINGVNLISQRALPAMTRLLSPSNYYDIEEDQGTKAPILCNFKGNAMKQTICSRKLRIQLPGFGLKVEAIADIESLYEINDGNDKSTLPDNNVFTNYKITTNNNIVHDYSGVGQMVPILLTKEETLVRDDQALIINDRLRFWDSYEDGYLGYLEFVRGVSREDQADGFMPENTTPFDLNKLGFTSIGILDIKDGYIDSGSKTYFIRPYASTDANECLNMASRYNLTVHSGGFGSPDDDQLAKVIGAYNNGSCVLEGDGYLTPDSVMWAVKTEYSTEGFTFTCSPYSCQADHFCEMAICPEGYEGGLYPPNYEKQYPDGTITPASCELDACDTVDPYEPVCGKETFCDTSNPRIIELPDGTCEEIYCAPGAGYLNSQTKLCEKMECPTGTHEIASGDCIKN